MHLRLHNILCDSERADMLPISVWLQHVIHSASMEVVTYVLTEMKQQNVGEKLETGVQGVHTF